jgi:hypothetical protein
MEDALQVATSPHDFKLLVASEGRTATTMDDLGDASRENGAAGPVTLRRPTTFPSAPGTGGGSAPPPVPASAP